MSNKRSQRNTKSFKKARARAGIPRQDLRSGGRVGFHLGSGAKHKEQGGDMGVTTWASDDDNEIHYSDPALEENVHSDNRNPDGTWKETAIPGPGGDPAAGIGPNPEKPIITKPDVAFIDQPKDLAIATPEDDIEDITTDADAVDTPTVITPDTGVAESGEAVRADLPGRTLKPEEQKKRFQDSDAFKNFDPNAAFSPTVMSRSSDGQWWPNPAQRDGYEEWLKSAPATEMDLEAATYTAEDAATLTPTVAASGAISKEPTASAADLTATTAAQRNAEQEEAAKATAAKRPGEPRSDEKLQQDWKNSSDYKEALAASTTKVNAEISELSDETRALRTRIRVAQRRRDSSLERQLNAQLSRSNSRLTELRSNKEGAAKEGISKESYDGWVNRQPRTSTEYAEGVTTDEAYEIADVDDPDVTTRIGKTISPYTINRLTRLAQERGVDLEDLPEYKEQIAKRTAQTGKAATRIDPDTGLPISQDMGDTAAQITDQATAEYYAIDYQPQGGNTDIDQNPLFQKAATRKAQTQEAAQRIAKELGDAPSLDLEGREAILGEAPVGTAAEIGGIPTFAAAQMEAVKGQDRMVGAADMLAVVADVPEEITAAIAEDPATVEAQLDTDPDPTVNAKIAALPEEALVSTQMSNLLAGMEEGKTPLWARPAVAAVEQMMASRGLSASSVGRDALFNAIIQSALPMAQSNAQALQQRAQQNLSNEQQSNLASAQNTMQVRMQNLANRQTAASQTASMSQQIKVQQGQFKQQAVITEAQQGQETRMADAQMEQQKAQQESAQRQQAAISTFSANAQMDLANLKAESLRSAKDMDAESAGRLAKYNADINKIMRQADFTQDMEKANLSAELQIEAIDLNNLNLAARDTMTAEQQERLTNFQTLVDFKKTNVQLAQQMELANLSNDQQMRYAELQDKVATDSANFNADNQFELAELTAKIQRSVRQAELDQRMEEVNLDAKLKVELSELSEKNATSRANMTAEQQTDLANLNTLVDFRKTNAQFAQQMDLANLANEQQIELANLQDKISTDSANFTEENRFRFQELNTHVQIMSQNEEFKQRADLAKLSMQERIELSNLQSKNQAASESMTAENIAQLQIFEKKMAAGEVNAQLAQQMGLANLSNEQSAAMFNAQVNANFDMTQFTFEQQAEMANSKFLQTMTATDLNNRQQAVMQDAASLAAMDMQEADALTKVSIENARNFLQMDMVNLNNDQQAVILDQQLSQQRILSDQSAENASRQFNASSENQVNQFMANLGSQMSQFNASQANAMEQFNTAEENRMEAQNVGNKLQADQINNQMAIQVDQLNAEDDLRRDQWSAANAQAIEQANITWRRQASTINSAAQNQANSMAAQQSYNLDMREMDQLWQQLRDEASYLRQGFQNDQQRKVALIATALGNPTTSRTTSLSTDKLRNILTLLGA